MYTHEIIIKLGLNLTSKELESSNSLEDKMNKMFFISKENKDILENIFYDLMKKKIINSYDLPNCTSFEKFESNLQGLIYRDYKLKDKEDKIEEHALFKYLSGPLKESIKISRIKREMIPIYRELKLEEPLVNDKENPKIIETENTKKLALLKNKEFELSSKNPILRAHILSSISYDYLDEIGNSLKEKISFLNQIDEILKKAFADIDQNKIKPFYDILDKLHNDKEYRENYETDNLYNSDEAFFDTMTDGQLGDYEDFDGTDDNIDNWSGA